MATYVPDPGGDWVAAVRGSTILVARAGSVRDVLALWADLRDPDPAAAVLDHVTAGGVSATPPFALVVRDPAAPSTRVVVRGPIRVRVGDVEVDGDGVTTWAERLVPGGEVVVSTNGAAVRPEPGTGDGASALPIVEGIVAAREVRSGGAEPVSVAEVHPAAQTAVPVPVRAAVPVPVPLPGPVSAPPAAVPVPPAPVDERTVVRDGAAEQTIVPDEDSVVGVSVPVRPIAASTITIGAPPPSAPPTVPVPAAPAPLIEPAGDHDGLTIASDDLRRLREARAAGAATVAAGAAASDPPAIEQVGLRMPDGTIEPLVDAVVLGRAPAIGKLAGGRVPRLVVIGAGDPDISRSHLRVALEGGTVVVTDLDSRNGTHVVAPGRPPAKLRPAEPTPVLTDTVIDLGGGWTIQVVTR